MKSAGEFSIWDFSLLVLAKKLSKDLLGPETTSEALAFEKDYLYRPISCLSIWFFLIVLVEKGGGGESP